MIIDASTVPRDTCLEADVCVVGGGAAGISLALTLAEEGVSVLLLESGHAREDDRDQALYAGEVADERLHSPPDRYRQRRFGGSTSIWGGRCVPFDSVDFESRSQVPYSGWPISYEDIAPYYPAANALAEAGHFEYDGDQVFGAGARPLIAGFSSPLVATSGLERFSCPTNFSTRYEHRLRRHPSIRVLTGANCTAVRLRDDAREVRRLDVATLDGNRFTAAARFFVLAVGGLETPRLLLSSRDVVAAGVGNEQDLVGRYYMCHIAGSVGALSIAGPTDQVRHGYELTPDGIYSRRRLSLVAAEQRRLGLMNMVARLHFPRISDPAHRNGVLSGLYLARSVIRHEYGKRLNDGAAASLAGYALHLRNVLMDPLDTSAFLLHWLTRRTLAQRKYPSVILGNRTNQFSLEINGEQAPRADSRITLTSATDELGMPRLRVDWRYSSIDIESVGRSLDVMAAEFARTGVATLRYDAATLEEDLLRFGAYGGHHIGTTRMGRDPRVSVVDGDCRVHSVDNLFIAGSAVFPTSSQANPTLTLLALTLRLAAHLRRRLETGA